MLAKTAAWFVSNDGRSVMLLFFLGQKSTSTRKVLRQERCGQIKGDSNFEGLEAFGCIWERWQRYSGDYSTVRRTQKTRLPLKHFLQMAS